MHNFIAAPSQVGKPSVWKWFRVFKAVGQVLREFRIAAGMPRSEVARQAKLDPSVLWRLENPKDGASPSFDLVRRVAACIGASLDDVASAIDRSRPAASQPTARDHLDRILDAVDALGVELSVTSKRRLKK